MLANAHAIAQSEQEEDTGDLPMPQYEDYEELAASFR